MADDVGVDPNPIVKRLNDEATWARWIALKEDIPEGTKILTYAANRGISSWVKVTPHDPTTETPSPRSLMSLHGIDPNCLPQRTLDFDYQSRKRRSSVFSFNSTKNDEKNEITNELVGISNLPETVLNRKRNKLEYERASIPCGMLAGSVLWIMWFICFNIPMANETSGPCRRRKIRCIISSGDQNSCVNCIRLRKQCTFLLKEPDSPPKRPTRQSYHRPRSVKSFGSASSHGLSHSQISPAHYSKEGTI